MTETTAYLEAAEQATLEPRYVIALSFDDADTDVTYITSHADCQVPPGTTAINRIDGAIEVKGISGQSQRINPDKAQHTIGSVTFKLLDVNNEISTKLKTKLDGGDGLRNKQVQLYKGEITLANWSDYNLRLTYIVDGQIKYKNGVYTLSCSDIQRTAKKTIFVPHQGALTSTITAAQMTIPITAADAGNKFPLVAHDANYSSQPNVTVGYIKIDDEIICHSGWTDVNFTDLTVVQRGAFSTQNVEHVVTAGQDDQKKQVEEYIYLQMAAPKMVYAILTGILDGQAANLPDHWHLSIPTKYVDLAGFQNLGDDLWNPSTGKGRMARFMGLEKENGKDFIERELALWAGFFLSVKTDGSYSPVRLLSTLPFSAYSEVIDESEIISYGDLVYDQPAVINNVRIDWNWLDTEDRFTKSNQLLDTDSIAKYQSADQRAYEFRGVFTGAHSDNDIQSYADAILDRYHEPPVRLSLVLQPKWDKLAVGQTIRVTCPYVWDVYADAILDRVFEVQQVKTDWITGKVTVSLFGGVSNSGQAPVASSAVLQDSYYTAVGTNLASVLTIVGGVVTASGTVTGAALNTSAIYYYDGDLEIGAGVTVTCSLNVLLKIKGFLTINGTLVFSGTNTQSGVFGESQSGKPAYMFKVGLAPVQVLLLASKSAGDSGRWKQMPKFSLTNPDGLSIGGLPNNLMGIPGKTGDAADIGIPATPVAGGAGGDGGGGGVIISRGATIAGAGQVITSGDDGAPGSFGIISSSTIYGQTGAGGYPGGVLFLVDGNFSLPTFGGTKSIALTGASPDPAVDVYAKKNTAQVVNAGEVAYGQTGVSSIDMSAGLIRAQYLPQPKAPFEWYPSDEQQQATGYNNKPQGWADLTKSVLGGKGINIANYDYSVGDVIQPVPGTVNNADFSYSSVFYIGSQSHKLVSTGANPQVYLGANSTDYNIRMSPNRKWIVSAYVRSDVALSEVQFTLRTNGSGAHVSTPVLINAPTVDTWVQVSSVIDLSGDSSTGAILRIDGNQVSDGSTLRVDGIMIEEQVGELTEPSAYALPATDADLTAFNTALNSTNIADLPSVDVQSSVASTWFNGMEANELAGWVANTGHTVAAESVDKFSGAQSMRVTTTILDTDASGTIGGVSIQIPERLALSLAGKQAKISLYAKTDDAVSFAQAAYSTNGDGDLGWRTFKPDATWRKYNFTYTIPDSSAAGVDYFAIQSATDGSVLIDHVVISTESTENTQITHALQASNWSIQKTPNDAGLNSLVYSETIERIVAVGSLKDPVLTVSEAIVYLSDDAVDWTEYDVHAVLSGGGSKSNAVAVADNGSIIVVGGWKGEFGAAEAMIATSTNGTTWTERTAPNPSATITQIIWGGGLFVAVGYDDGTDAYIITSPDGITWTERSNPKAFWLHDIIYEDGIYIAGGRSDGVDAYLITSADAITWTERSNTTINNIYEIAYNNGEFIAAGEINTGVYIVSPDGINWFERGYPATAPLNHIRSIAKGRHGLLMVGSGGLILSSVDGVTWEQRTQAIFTQLQAVIYHNNRYICVGDYNGVDSAGIITSLVL